MPDKEPLKVVAEIAPYDPEKEKFYGTHIELTTEYYGHKCVGNPLKVWFMSEWIGGYKPSHREGPEPDIGGNHYESQGDLAVAEWLVRAINAYNEPFPQLEDDEDEVL